MTLQYPFALLQQQHQLRFDDAKGLRGSPFRPNGEDAQETSVSNRHFNSGHLNVGQIRQIFRLLRHLGRRRNAFRKWKDEKILLSAFEVDGQFHEVEDEVALLKLVTFGREEGLESVDEVIVDAAADFSAADHRRPEILQVLCQIV